MKIRKLEFKETYKNGKVGDFGEKAKKNLHLSTY
jgi:hypothetical protein